MTDALSDALAALQSAGMDLVWPALAFAAIALIARGAAAFRTARAAAGEVSTNLTLFVVDVLFITPALAVALAAMGGWMQASGVSIVSREVWEAWPQWLVACVGVFAGDFIGYWRHRFEHIVFIWPAHAVHHSDRAMTWTTGLRFHPINRFTTALIDTGVLALLGFPVWALAANNLVRHYYGLFIHMDLPWTYGPLGRVFVSPAMHRWHHARDKAGYNFATVFSVFDQAFGTFHVPGPCTVPLGINEDSGRGTLGQLLHPFAVLWRQIRRTTPLAASSGPV